jgi:pimeloyl-ACP methyl ester carboxylesterase
MPSPIRLLPVASFVCVAALAAAAPAGAETVWLCKPGMKNDACAGSLKTAVLTPAEKTLRIENVKRARKPRFDCFYVYPTVSGQPALGATKARDPEILSIAHFQASRYTEHCRMYAPVYRQLTLTGIRSADPSIPGLRDTAYADVREAWRTYLKKHNKGRGVVLVGHSQGTFMLRELIAREIDRKPKVRRRLISAQLIGGNVTVKKGKDAGGDFRNVKACRSAKQIGCVIAFSVFGETPPANAIFGRTAIPGREVLCTNPAALGGGAAKLDPLFPSEPFAPGSIIGAATLAAAGKPLPNVKAPWIAAPGAYRARCSSAAGADVLRVDPLRGARRFVNVPDATWGLHLVDANIAQGTLVELAARQAAEYRRAAGR